MDKIKKQIEELISEARSQANMGTLTPRERSFVIKKIKHLKAVSAYLDTDPSPAFVKKEISRITKRIKLIQDGYDYWSKTNQLPPMSHAKEFAFYEKEMGVEKLKAQADMLTAVARYMELEKMGANVE